MPGDLKNRSADSPAAGAGLRPGLQGKVVIWFTRVAEVFLAETYAAPTSWAGPSNDRVGGSFRAFDCA